MTSNSDSIGVFDSGVGGLSILKAIQEQMPNENLIYVADSEFTPYGNKSERQIESRVLKIAEHLISLKVKAIVVACNTATAAAITTLRSHYDIPIIGLEPALKPASEHTTNQRIGVLATQSTLDSQKYKKLKDQFSRSIHWIEKASQLFVELVENASEITPIERALIEAELAEFKQVGIDCLVLGCTHYPFLSKTITDIMGSEVTLFESGLPVAKELERRLQNNRNDRVQVNSIQYYSSNPAKAQLIFNSLLGENIEIGLFE